MAHSSCASTIKRNPCKECGGLSICLHQRCRRLKICGAKGTHFTEEATLFDVVTRSHLCSRVLPVSTGLPAGLRLFRHRTQAIVVVVCRQGWTSCRTHMRRPLLLNATHIRLLLSLQPLSPQTMGLDDLGPRKGAVSGAVHRLPAPVTHSSGSYTQDCTGLGESAACSRRGRCRKRSRACSHPPLTVRVRRAAETVERLPQTAWWQKPMPLNVL